MKFASDEAIFTELSTYLKYEFLIADSFPLEVCKFGRAHFCKSFKSDEATTVIVHQKTGLSATKFTLLIPSMIFEITPTNINDRKGVHWNL